MDIIFYSLRNDKVSKECIIDSWTAGSRFTIGYKFYGQPCITRHQIYRASYALSINIFHIDYFNIIIIL